MLKLAIFCLGILTLCGAANAQDSEVLKSRVLATLRRSSLVSGGMHPYRIAADLIIFDGAGKNPLKGTLEILRRDRTTRTTVVFPESTIVLLTSPQGTDTLDRGTPPYFAPILVRAFKQPVNFNGFDAVPVLLSKEVRDYDPECLSLLTTEQATISGPKPSQHAVCVDSKNDKLRIIINGEQTLLRDDIVPFEEHEVARHLRLQLAGVTVAELQVTQLESAPVLDAELTPTPEMTHMPPLAEHVSANVIAGRLLKHDNPKYPGIAKAAHIQGVVMLHAIIGKDGLISNLSVISSPDPILSESSLKAVAKWTYEPYLLNGEPTEVDTTITVSFAMGKN